MTKAWRFRMRTFVQRGTRGVANSALSHCHDYVCLNFGSVPTPCAWPDILTAKLIRRLDAAPATQRSFEFAGYGIGDHVKSFRAPDHLLAERDALAAAREQQALTQYFFGDPPPGYSALHGKTGLR